MGLGSFFKKGLKDLVKGLFTPWTLLGPMGMGIGIMQEKQKQQMQQLKKQEQTEALIEAENTKQKQAAYENQFNSDLEKQRKSGASSNVIYAGVLGSKGKVGLGGQKNLLGL
ncbi:MAG: hypothetical protein ACI4PW_05270 [Alphaproteobacteria bacterium]